MDVAEFDKFADEYNNLHQEYIRITGKTPSILQNIKFVT